MLTSVDSGEEIKKLPHKRDFDKWRAHISDSNFDTIVDELEKK